jgi:hypothetical protein
MLFATALSLSAIAEFYSIMGLIAIFSGAATSIMIMGGILGVAKLVLTSWLYRNWKETSLLLKSYFIVAIFILMSLTSMGIFGYLSKAHLDQGIVSGDAVAAVALFDEKIKLEKENINAARKTLSQLDSQVDAALSRSTDTAGADKSSIIRKSQAKERSKLVDEIGASQKAITSLNEERAPKAVELRKVEAEVGPIKYIAALIYEDSTNQDTLEKAVRAIILLIVTVFDPLAVLMLIAYNQSVSQRIQPIVEPKIQVDSEPEPKQKRKPKLKIESVSEAQRLKGNTELSFDDSDNTQAENNLQLNNFNVHDARPVI